MERVSSTPKRSMGLVEWNELSDRSLELVSPLQSLCSEVAFTHVPAAWTTAPSTPDGRGALRPLRGLPRERPSPESAETPASGQGGSVARPTLPRDRA